MDELIAAAPERFEILGELGRGGMAVVYRARDRHTESEVALKVLLPHLQDNELVVSRFRRELAASRLVDHPRVVTIHELVEAPGFCCLVMARHPGVDLKRWLRRQGPLAPQLVRQIGLEVASELAAIEAHLDELAALDAGMFQSVSVMLREVSADLEVELELAELTEARAAPAQAHQVQP